MTIVAVIGWIATATGMTLGIPQLVRLARTRRVDGLSLIGMQAVVSMNIGWMMHGIRIGQPPQAIASGVSLLTVLPTVILLSRALGRRTSTTLLPSFALAAVMIAIDQFIGSSAYGSFALIPMVIALGGQTLALVRSHHVLGVSTPTLILGSINQGLWTVWAFLVVDSGTMISTTMASIFVVFNGVWYVLRRTGLRAFFPYPQDVSAAPTLVSACPQVVEA